MKVAGIIAEYNPFHNGHQYHIEETKRQTGADYVIALMSGDVVQRGAPAFLDKYERTFCALAGGCDLVLELPAVYSSASAEFFAAGAVSILDRLGVSDWLSFGSEEGNLEPLQSIAQILIKEPEKYKKLLRSHLKSGLSFPLAREKALSDYGKSCLDGPLSDHIILSLKGANNILALEYLKSQYRISSTIRPHTVLRKDAPYHDKNFHDEIASASAIREHLKSQAKLAPVLQTVPEETASFLSRYTKFPDHNSLTPYLHGTLLNGNHWDDILDWDKEMANRLSSLPWSIMTFSEIADD